MDWFAILWLALLVLFVFAEASTVTIVSMWFAAGALVALIANLLGAELWLQVVLFFAVSALLLAALRPFIKKYFNPRREKTNVDAIIGTVGIVTVAIDNIEAVGQVKLSGMEWSARSTSGDNIPVGTRVKVDKIQGVKAFVTPETVLVNN